jgi:hypothetical protein
MTLEKALFRVNLPGVTFIWLRGFVNSLVPIREPGGAVLKVTTKLVKQRAD